MDMVRIQKSSGRHVDCGSHDSPSSAFTLIELLVVIAVVGVLFLLLIPALGASRQSDRAVWCMSNGRQLMKATQMYASDTGGLLPPNPDDVNYRFGHSWVAGNATGSGPSSSWAPVSWFEDARRFLLLPYVKTIKVLKCPADRRTGRFEDGTTGPALRTVSMNGVVGTACASWKNGGPHIGRPELETRAPHLTGTANDRVLHAI